MTGLETKTNEEVQAMMAYVVAKLEELEVAKEMTAERLDLMRHRRMLDREMYERGF